MITFTPSRGSILMCDFDMATVPPEMRKRRRVIVLSPKSYNKRPSMAVPGKCIVVPLSVTEPRTPQPSHVAIPDDRYASITKPVWAICEMVAHVSHARLDRVASGKKFLSESITADDLQSIENALKHALGFPAE
ncbi:type II toxin-antitoxin system PemK/MazF family toxin [Agrobacterium sp. NPDC090283]|uniref:type II toxin-antitoxin system PemK/MazF family toxin n=1 Tax=Agrobacterium sp. NPDC090283 TaxID=3363920 RepID=UPI00383A0F90